MTAQPTQQPPAVVLPLRAGHLTMAQVFELYLATYTGRDSARYWRVEWWSMRIGQLRLADLTDDHVHAELERLSREPSRTYAGRDVEGRPIYRARGGALAPATLNRYAATLAAVCTWCIKRRVAPQGWQHPCRSIERRPEDNLKTRFLSDEECQRLLDACRASQWPRLRLLVLMALTTGARRGELSALTWGHVDLDGATATLPRTKSGKPRVLPLVPAVVEELRRFKAGASTLVFRSAKAPDRVYSFEGRFRLALKAAGIRGVTFHTLRHSAASMLARNGATLYEVGEVLGHRQMQTTMRYAHLAVGHKAALVNRVMGGLQ
ncbi:MAG: tyrosine-type recombinase/integrase [Betaproteobacteria bacterium]|jgi:integrase|nr:site-specific integrase [Rubrivivax sp.]